MKELCECSKCGHRWWARVSEISDSGVFIKDGDGVCPECGGDDFECIDEMVD